MALEPYLHNYLTFLRTQKHLAFNSQESYRLDLSDFIAFAKKQNIDSPKLLNKNLLRGYLAYLKDSKRVAEATVSRHITAIRGWFKYLDRYHGDSFTSAEILRFGRRIRHKRALPKALAQEQLTRLLNFAKNIAQKARGRSRWRAMRDWAIVETFYSSGLRVSELCHLTKDNLSLDQGLIRLYGKGSRERVVPVGEQALKAIRVYLYERQANIALGTLPESPNIFCNRGGGALSRVAVEQNLKKLAARVDLKLTPHQLRHSFATHLLLRGIDLRSLQELMGHKSLEATQVYTAITPANLKKIYDRTHPGI